MKNMKNTKVLNSMIKRPRQKRKFRSLKSALVVGTIGITMMGTRLAGRQDTVVKAGEPSTAIVQSDRSQESIQLPSLFSGSNRGSQVQLQAIPRVITPRIGPVARTRSSR